MSLEGQTVLVTGASRGLGKSIAVNFAKNKAVVIGTATTEEGANSITHFFNKYNMNTCKGIRLNLSDQESVNNLYNTINNNYEAMPSIVVNNAGITCDSLFLKMKSSDSSNDTIKQDESVR